MLAGALRINSALARATRPWHKPLNSFQSVRLPASAASAASSAVVILARFLFLPCAGDVVLQRRNQLFVKQGAVIGVVDDQVPVHEIAELAQASELADLAAVHLDVGQVMAALFGALDHIRQLAVLPGSRREDFSAAFAEQVF